MQKLTIGHFSRFVVEKFELDTARLEKVYHSVNEQSVQAGLIGRRSGRGCVILDRVRVFHQSDTVEQIHFWLFVNPIDGRQQLVLETRSKLCGKKRKSPTILFIETNAVPEKSYPVDCTNGTRGLFEKKNNATFSKNTNKPSSNDGVLRAKFNYYYCQRNR